MITAKFENTTSRTVEKLIANVVNSANENHDDDDEQLDYVVQELRKHDLFWVYRGGSHVAIHYADAAGQPNYDRICLIV